MRLMHPLAGEFTLRYETFALANDQELALSTCDARPGSPDAEALRLVASRTGTERRRTPHYPLRMASR